MSEVTGGTIAFPNQSLTPAGGLRADSGQEFIGVDGSTCIASTYSPAILRISLPSRLVGRPLRFAPGTGASLRSSWSATRRVIPSGLLSPFTIEHFPVAPTTAAG